MKLWRLDATLCGPLLFPYLKEKDLRSWSTWAALACKSLLFMHVKSTCPSNSLLSKRMSRSMPSSWHLCDPFFFSIRHKLFRRTRKFTLYISRFPCSLDLSWDIYLRNTEIYLGPNFFAYFNLSYLNTPLCYKCSYRQNGYCHFMEFP